MTKGEIDKILGEFETTKERNMVVVDFGNVQKWEQSLGWRIGIKELGNLVKKISVGKRFLRRFYYGSDYGPKEKSDQLVNWSRMVLEKATMSGFDVVSKRVKYILIRFTKWDSKRNAILMLK